MWTLASCCFPVTPISWTWASGQSAAVGLLGPWLLMQGVPSKQAPPVPRWAEAVLIPVKEQASGRAGLPHQELEITTLTTMLP